MTTMGLLANKKGHLPTCVIAPAASLSLSTRQLVAEELLVAIVDRYLETDRFGSTRRMLIRSVVTGVSLIVIVPLV